MAKRVHGSCVMTDTTLPDGFDPSGYAWKIELRYDGRKMTTSYFTGSLAGEPTIAGVLESLLMDYDCSLGTFEDFCANLGYDEDSRKAEQVYRSCVEQSAQFKRLLGVDEVNPDYTDSEVWAKNLAAEEWS